MNPMDRNKQNNPFHSYSYIPPSSRRSDNQTGFHPSTAPSSELQLQQQYQSLTTISDLGEPMSAFDDMRFPPPRRGTVTPFPPVYASARQVSVADPRLAAVGAMRERLLVDIQQNMQEIDREITSLEERSIVSRYIPTPLSSVTTRRQSSLDKHDDSQFWPRKPRKVYSVVPRIDTSPSKKNSASVLSNPTHKIILPSYVGRYHYGPETADSVIRVGDPENSDRKSAVKEIPKLTLREPINLDKLLRNQSGMSQNRALIFVPQFEDNTEMEFNEKVDEFQQSHFTDADTARLSTVSSSHLSRSADRIKIQDFQLFTHTAPEPKVETPTKSPAVSNKSEVKSTIPSPVTHKTPEPKVEVRAKSPAVSNKSEVKSTISSPVTAKAPEPKIEVPAKVPAVVKKAEAHSTKPTIPPPITHKAPQPKLEVPAKSPAILKKTEANLKKVTIPPPITRKVPDVKVEVRAKSSAVSEKPEMSFTNPIILSAVKHIHGSKKPEESHSPSLQTTKQDSDVNTAYFFSDYGTGGEGEEDRISIDPRQFIIPGESENLSDDNISDTLIGQSQISSLNPYSMVQYHFDEFKERESKTPDATTTHTLTPTSLLPTENAFLMPITDNHQTKRFNHDRDDIASTTISSTDTTPRSPDSPLATERKASSTTMNSLRQPTLSIDRSSQNQSPNGISRGPTISSADIHKQSTHHTSNDSRRRSPLPVPLNSPDSTDVQPSTSRPPTPERRNSISALDQTILLTPIDVDDLIDPPADSEHDAPNPKENQVETIPPSVEDQIDYDDIFPPITPSQRRSRLSLLVQRPKPKVKKPIEDQSQVDIPRTNEPVTQKSERHVAFAAEIAHERVEESAPVRTWRERIDDALSKERFPVNKYSHIKSRVNTFTNFEYRPKQFVVVQRKKPRGNKKRTSPIQPAPLTKRLTPQMLGRVQRLPDGQPTVFHEKLEWKSPSKLRSYSVANLHYQPRQREIKVLNQKPRSHSESRIADLMKTAPLMHTISLPTIVDDDELSLLEQPSNSEMKIFDVQQSSSKFQESLLTDSSWNSRRSDKIIFDGKLVWRKESKLKDSIWGNINYQPKKSTVQIFHEPLRWNHRSKIQITHSLTLSKYWSESDLHQLKKKKALFYEYRNLKWNDIVTTDNQYSFVSLTQDYSEDEKSPANRPKWNAVSKSRSVNSIYNPNIPNLNVRRGWNLDLRRKRVHKLPPLKRKRVQEQIAPLAIEGPLSNNPSGIDENFSPVLITQDQRTSIDYTATPASRALVPVPHIPDLPLLSETPRSQRPVQQEWYDRFSRSRSTHRTDVGRTRNNSIQDLNGSAYQVTTPREFRSSTRNSQSSVMSGVLLDSSIRTNRATELRLSRDLEEHHQHSHDPSQSMPFEIRGFRLEGTQLTVPNNASIRPLSNINYHASERIKSRRLYPWASLHPNGTLSRNSSLLPITELRHPSFESSTIVVPQLIQEE